MLVLGAPLSSAARRVFRPRAVACLADTAFAMEESFGNGSGVGALMVPTVISAVCEKSRLTLLAASFLYVEFLNGV